jgi:hypothetical protein
LAPRVLTDISTPVLSYSQFDDLIYETQRKLDSEVNQESPLVVQPEDALSRIASLLLRIRGPSHLSQIVGLFAANPVPAVRARIRTFYIDYLTRPLDILSAPTPSGVESLQLFSLVLSRFHDFLPHFEPPEQIELLEAVSKLLLLVSPDPQQLEDKKDKKEKKEKRDILPFVVYEAVATACSATLSSCISRRIPQDVILSFARDVLTKAIAIAKNVARMSRKTHTQLSSNVIYIGILLPFIAALGHS